jgi:triosephosphate isomerase
MRTPIIAGNWKMHKTVDESADLVREMRRGLNAVTGVEKVLCPPFISLVAVSELLRPTSIRLGAQNMHWEGQGAFTGEISPLMLEGLCEYVIIGHSERRMYFGETNESVNRKVHAALSHSLVPIMCVGENLEQNEAGETESFVSEQIRSGLAGLSEQQVATMVIAYEPIWAIGTGRAATGVVANRIIGVVIRGAIAQLCGEATAQTVRVQYGGSVKPANINEFMTQPDIDGALVGGASLKAADFVEIVRISAQAKGVSG